MQPTEPEVLTLVLGALATIKAAKPENEKFSVAPDTPLVGQRAVLTSLELVAFIVEVETRLLEECGVQITLTDDRAFSEARSPFRRPSALAQYIVARWEVPAVETA